MNFEDCTLVELRQLAKEKGVKNVSKLKKDELIQMLSESCDEKEKTNEKSASVSENTNIKENNSVTAEITESSSNSTYKVTNADDQIIEGILEVLPDGYGFLRGENYLSTPKDVYISPVQIRRFKLDKGDKVKGIARQPKEGEKFPALIYVGEVNGEAPEKAYRRKNLMI